ncbi:hypothetical protein M432DRAFT_68634 [Thermoascus aurantiacus ATCC 26904]
MASGRSGGRSWLTSLFSILKPTTHRSGSHVMSVHHHHRLVSHIQHSERRLFHLFPFPAFLSIFPPPAASIMCHMPFLFYFSFLFFSSPPPPLSCNVMCITR